MARSSRLPAAGPKQLARLELLRDLPPAALADAAAHARIQQVRRGGVIFRQGGIADCCHALIAGQVRIAQSGEQGEQLIVRFIAPGQTFGTMGLFTDRYYPAEARAVADSVTACWTEKALVSLVHAHPQIAINLVKIAGARLREVQERLRELATQRVDRRIAHVLLRLAALQGCEGGGRASIDFPLTRQDVAEMCGTTLHTVSRVFTAWQRAGYIATQRRRLIIQSLERIRSLAAGPGERDC